MHKPKFNPLANLPNVPLVGQPEPDYAIGIPLFIPDDPRAVAQLTDSIAKQKAKKGKGDIAVIFGSPPKRIRCFSYEEFVELIFGSKKDAEAASGGIENEARLISTGD